MSRHSEARAREMARSTSILFGAGSLITGAGLLLPHDRRVDAAGLLAVVLATGLVAILLAWRRERMPARAYPLIAAVGTVAVSSGLFFNGERHGGPVGSDEMFYLWITLWAAYHFTRAALAVQVALILVAYAGTLILIDPGSAGTSRFISLSGLIVGAAIVVRLLAERNERLVEELRAAALTDPLTGLANRRGLEAAFAREGARTLRTGRPFGLLVLDLDRFKQLNDELGHKAGDRALVEIAGLLLAHAREADTAARTGGDEFALLLSDTDAVGTAAVAGRLAAAVEAHTRAAEWPASASIGTAVSAVDGTSMDAIMRHADMRLYAAKRDHHAELGSTPPLRRAS
jgi:diguanylate cyclase (GGDEF)-like protein